MSAGQIRIQVNGRERAVTSGLTLAQLLDQLKLDRRAVVVERNRHIIRRDALDDVALQSDDEIELVHFVGGG